MSDISERILEIILNKDISYGELATTTGIPKSALQRYATGQTEKIPIDRLEKIAKAIGTTTAYLMGWEITTNKTPTPKSEHDPNEIMFALSRGGEREITDEMFEEVKRFAAFIAEHERNNKLQEE